jgi:hypothetical protein
MSRTLLIVLAVLGGCCVLCGGSLALLGLLGDTVEQGPPAGPSSGPALAGAHPQELVGFWSCDANKLALFEDGTARKWVRHHWDGSNTGNTCKLEGDFTGTWSSGEGTLSLDLTEGRWVDCRGGQTFEEITATYSRRFTFASGIGKKVLWLRDEHGESGYNLECASPAGCSFEPKPIQ